MRTLMVDLSMPRYDRPSCHVLSESGHDFVRGVTAGKLTFVIGLHYFIK